MATYSRKTARLDAFEPRLSSKPLHSLSHNSRKPKRLEPPKKKLRLTQMTIDLGGNPQKTCKECRMEYVPSNAEDAKLHKQYHAAHLAGLCVSKQFWAQAKMVWRGRRREPTRRQGLLAKNKSYVEDAIVKIGRTDAAAARNIAAKALSLVERELGAVKTSEKELWEQVFVRKEQSEEGCAEDVDNAPPLEHLCDRFKMFLYIQDNRCVGCCLTERIKTGRKVVEPVETSEGSPIPVSDEASSATLGISRIWVAEEWRGQSIGIELLQAAASTFLQRGVVGKEKIAFSQPTSSGAKLARRWFGESAGWLVYDDGLGHAPVGAESDVGQTQT